MSKAQALLAFNTRWRIEGMLKLILKWLEHKPAHKRVLKGLSVTA